MVKTEESELTPSEIIGKLEQISRAISGQASALDGLTDDISSGTSVSIPAMYVCAVGHLLEDLSSELDKTLKVLKTKGVNAAMTAASAK